MMQAMQDTRDNSAHTSSPGAAFNISWACVADTLWTTHVSPAKIYQSSSSSPCQADVLAEECLPPT